jgi:hypothetical protein
MDLVTLGIGVALGAMFSPFWMKVWAWVKSKFGGTTPPAA